MRTVTSTRAQKDLPPINTKFKICVFEFYDTNIFLILENSYLKLCGGTSLGSDKHLTPGRPGRPKLELIHPNKSIKRALIISLPKNNTILHFP